MPFSARIVNIIAVDRRLGFSYSKLPADPLKFSVCSNWTALASIIRKHKRRWRNVFALFLHDLSSGNKENRAYFGIHFLYNPVNIYATTSREIIIWTSTYTLCTYLLSKNVPRSASLDSRWWRHTR